MYVNVTGLSCMLEQVYAARALFSCYELCVDHLRAHDAFLGTSQSCAVHCRSLLLSPCTTNLQITRFDRLVEGRSVKGCRMLMTPHTTHCKECAQHAADDQPLPVTVVQEDVLYALSQSDSMQDMGVEDLAQLTPDSRSKMLYLMNDEGGSTSTLAYLRSVYNTPGHARTQWANFVERVKDLAVAQGLKDVPKTVEEVRLCCAVLPTTSRPNTWEQYGEYCR